MGCKTATGNGVMTYLGGVIDSVSHYAFMPALVYDDQLQKPMVEFYYVDKDTSIELTEDIQYLAGTYDPSDYVDYYDVKADTIRYFALNGPTESMRENLRCLYNNWYRFDRNYSRI